MGVIRLILENGLRLPLARSVRRILRHRGDSGKGAAIRPTISSPSSPIGSRSHLREQGVRHDLVAAVFALGHEDDLVRLLARVDALAAFLGSEDGANLLVAYRRAANIVRIEEKKDGVSYVGAIDPDRLR